MIEELYLLCESGAGLSAIAVRACTLIRDLAGADSSSIFWLDFDGQPAGFYHDCAPAELKDFFVTRFDDLFSDPEEWNMVSGLQPREPSIGKMMDPEKLAEFRQCNVYTYLRKPLDHHHCFDIRVDVDGRGMALVCLWNRMDNPFTAKHFELLKPVQAMLQRAARVRDPLAHWRSQDIRAAQFATDLGGERLLYISEAAEDLLRNGHLLRQNLPMAQSLREAPLFARQLAAMLGGSEGGPAQIHLPVTEGRLAATASHARRVHDGTGDDGQMFVTLELQVPKEVEAVQKAAALPLTQLQKEMLLFAVWGGERADCERIFGVAPEALKKHVRAILNATGFVRWQDLPGFIAH